jgi:subtilisin family serine protease
VRIFTNFYKTSEPSHLRGASFLLAWALACAFNSLCYAAPPAALEYYAGEYVVTLPVQSVGPHFAGRMGALSTPRLEEFGTVMKRFRGSTVLLSAGRSSHRDPSSAVSAMSAGIGISEADLFCKEMIAQGVVASCTPNYRLSISQVPVPEPVPDPLLGGLWGLTTEGVDAARAWNLTEGSSDVVVAVIDTGIDYTHPDLAANIWVNPGEIAGNGVDDDGNGFIDDVHGANFTPWATARGDSLDDNNHGTHVAGTIGAVHGNGIGVGGINKQVKLMALKFMDSNGSGRLSDAIAAIDYMVTMKVNHNINIRVSNNSWGGGGYSPALFAAIERARDVGIIFVAAAGNSATDIDLFPAYPASYEVSNVVSVAALSQGQSLATFSNYGAEGVDIAAPGVNVVSTLRGGQYGSLSGTSMAAPHVVGSLALLFALEPTMGITEALERLYETGREVAGLTRPEGMGGYVRTRRTVSAARLVYNERTPLGGGSGGEASCGYSFQTANIVTGGAVDGAADRAPIVNQVDEGSFVRLDLPFDFPFFKTSTRTLYISPNGLVYLNEPRGPDYLVAHRAPNFSIAAFHSDLTPRAASQGVRYHLGADRVTIAWNAEHYTLLGYGPITARLTLYPSGLVVSSVSFEGAQDPVLMSRLVLGDAFQTPVVPALGLIGASAGSNENSSTLNIAQVQRSLLTAPGQRLDLQVTMIPTCFESPLPETELTIASINKIRLKQKRNRTVEALYSGAGSGKIPLTVTLNRTQCEQTAWGTLEQGIGSKKFNVPVGVARVALQSPTSARGAVSMRGATSSTPGRRLRKMCERVVNAIAR